MSTVASELREIDNYHMKKIHNYNHRKKKRTDNFIAPTSTPPPKKNNTNKNKDNKVKKSNDLMGFIYSHTYQI